MFGFLQEANEKLIKQAFYNAAALLFAVSACGAAAAVFLVLEAFLRPLLWAVLCGTFLYPFKYKLTETVRSWLKGLLDSGTPLTVGVVVLPLRVVDRVSDGMGAVVVRRWRILVAVGMALPVMYMLYRYAPVMTVFYVMQRVWTFSYQMLGYFRTMWVWSAVVGYILLLVFFWTPGSQAILSGLSVIIWALLLFHLATVTTYRVPLFALSMVVIIAGFVAELKQPSSTATETDGGRANATLAAHLSAIFLNDSASNSSSETHNADDSPMTRDTSDGPPTDGTADVSAAVAVKPVKLSDRFFFALLWACLVVEVWAHTWMVPVLMFPLVIYVLKRLAAVLGVWQWLRMRLCYCSVPVLAWVESRRGAIFPLPVRGLWSLLRRGDKIILHVLEASSDKLMSVFMVLCLVVGSILLTAILAIQIQLECVHLVHVTSDLVNETVSQYPQINDWMPGSANVQNAVDSMMDNAYMYGREWIVNKVEQTLSGDDSVNKSLLSKQVVDVWDRLYVAWMARNETMTQPEMALDSDDKDVWETFRLTDGALDTVTGLFAVAQENIDTLYSVIESVWVVVVGNVNLAISIITSVLSTVFFGGTAILNFVISAVVFLTTLFYLLASSGDQYKPMEWLSTLTPPSTVVGSSFGKAVERGIRSVFGASLKLSAFYGLYTWLTHTIFGIQIVFIPAALAAVFGAVPFVGTYWAAVPAVLELWLLQGNGYTAILLLVCHLLPTYCVDTAIYSDIKGGHPYVTGLAVAGGMYWFGLEGAIIGPILLCFLVVIFNVYGSIIHETNPPPDLDGFDGEPVPLPPLKTPLQSSTPDPSKFADKYLHK